MILSTSTNSWLLEITLSHSWNISELKWSSIYIILYLYIYIYRNIIEPNGEFSIAQVFLECDWQQPGELLGVIEPQLQIPLLGHLDSCNVQR
jgi:hypothetical protein